MMQTFAPHVELTYLTVPQHRLDIYIHFFNTTSVVGSSSFSTLFNLRKRSIVCIFFSLLIISVVVRAGLTVLCSRA